MMGKQIILILIMIACALLFIIQWFRQVFRLVHGQVRPFSKVGVSLNWLLILGLILSAGELFFTSPQIRTAKPAVTTKTVKDKAPAKKVTHQAPKIAAAASSNRTTDNEQPTGTTTVMANTHLQLDRQGKVAAKLTVPAQTQLQIIEAANGNVLQTFPPQPTVTSVDFMFNKVGNYYLVVTKETAAKTVVVSVTQ